MTRLRSLPTCVSCRPLAWQLSMTTPTWCVCTVMPHCCVAYLATQTLGSYPLMKCGGGLAAPAPPSPVDPVTGEAHLTMAMRHRRAALEEHRKQREGQADPGADQVVG